MPRTGVERARLCKSSGERELRFTEAEFGFVGNQQDAAKFLVSSDEPVGAIVTIGEVSWCKYICPVPAGPAEHECQFLTSSAILWQRAPGRDLDQPQVALCRFGEWDRKLPNALTQGTPVDIIQPRADLD